MRFIIYLGYVSIVPVSLFWTYIFNASVYKNKSVIVWIKYFASLDWVLFPDTDT